MTAARLVADLGAAVVAVSVILGGCVSGPRREVWLRDGQPVGTILVSPTPDGSEYRYFDSANLLVRTEMRNASSALVDGDCAVEFSYDAERRVVMESYLDASGRPCRSKGGFASLEHRYSVGPGGESVEENVLLDESGQVVGGRHGWAIARFVRARPGAEIDELLLSDERGNPAAAAWGDVIGTARVKYMTLEGVGAVRCAVYYDASGGILARRTLSGVTSHREHSETVSGGGR